MAANFYRQGFSGTAMRLRLVLICVASALLLVGCSSTPEQQVDKARQAYQKHNYHAAEVQLKSVLRKHADNGEAWALLGHVSLAERDYDDAIHQFRKARTNGQPAAALALPLGHALIANGKYKKALKVLQVHDDDAPAQTRAQIASLRGDAQAGLGNRDKAASAYASALKIKPGLAEALQGRARLAMQRGDLQSARTALSKAVSTHPDDVNSLTLLGQVNYQLQQCDRAIAHLSHAMKIGANKMTGAQRQGSQTLLADCQLRAGNAEAAQKNIDAILAANQNNPYGNYLQALMDIRQGRLKDAANHVQATLNVNPDYLRGMTLMAWLRIVQGRPDDAQPFLSQVLKRAPGNVAAVRLQAGLWMAQNQDKKAQELLQKAHQRNPDQQGLHEALADVATRLKQQKSRGGKAGGADNVSLQLDLVRSLAQTGSGAAARTVLAKIEPKTDAERRSIEIARVRIALATGARKKALEHAETLAKKNPGDAGISTLLAQTYVAAGRYDDAADVLTKAHKAHPDEASIVHAQAQLAARRGRYDEAIQDLAPLHQAHPEDTDLTLTLAGLYARADKADKKIKLLRSAADRQPESDALNKALARAYLTSGKTDKAMSLIDERLKSKAKGNSKTRAGNDAAEWLHLKGVAQLMDGQTDTGLKTLNQAIDKAPANSRLAFNVAKAELAFGRSQDAIKHLQKLRRKSPDFLPAAGLLALAQSDAGDVDAALDQVTDLRQAGHGFDADVLDGAVLRAAKRFAKADAAYAKAYQQRPSARLAMLRFQTRQAGHLDHPAKPLEKWLNQTPGDTGVALQLASWYQQHGQVDHATALYHKVLDAHPNAVVALNNLALIHADSDPEQALDYARNAHDKAPDSAAVTDTLGWLLVGQNQLDHGITLLDKADKAAGDDNPVIRFHLGAALARRDGSNDDKRARALLKQAVSAGLPQQENHRAEALLKQMG